ncbi:phage tail assembly chaperone [Pseudomonas sp.]|uniref:phage tail assembly chaperone n=1 Tax=Pseudomonas sp. TaxID=306 RepID=UPI003C5784B1
MKYFVNDVGEVFAFDLEADAPDSLRAISEDEAMVLAAGPAPLPDLTAIERVWRDTELLEVTWLRDRHRDQLEIDLATTLSASQFKELLIYMQALRDWPQLPDFPNTSHRPIAPAWIADQSK